MLRSLDRPRGRPRRVLHRREHPEQFGDAVVDAMVHLLDRRATTPLSVCSTATAAASATISGASQALFTIVIADWHPA
jgi:hypothetical protein